MSKGCLQQSGNGRLERWTGQFLGLPVCSLRLSLVEPSINQVRGSQIAKTKLPIRKAQERHGKKGQKGRKKAPQTPTPATLHASDRAEVKLL
jgi:hypothetical protein